jgi:hypothetical protein
MDQLLVDEQVVRALHDPPAHPVGAEPGGRLLLPEVVIDPVKQLGSIPSANPNLLVSCFHFWPESTE